VLIEILLFISLYFFVFEPEFVGINSNSNASRTLPIQPQGLGINIREEIKKGKLKTSRFVKTKKMNNLTLFSFDNFVNNTIC